MVVIDATMLLLLLRPSAAVPARIDKPKERVDHLVAKLDKAHTKIVIPTPALSEVLVRAGAGASQEIVDKLDKLSVFKIEPFDARAAIEVATMARAALTRTKTKPNAAATYAKVKYDRQIVAIAKVCGADTIYSDDGDIRALGKEAKIAVVGLADLPLPPEDNQMKLTLDGPHGSASSAVSKKQE